MNMRKRFCAFAFVILNFLLPIYCDTFHILEKGETLYSISRKYSVPLSVILERNNIADAGKIAAGKKIYIPDIYTVKKGDTLYSIARTLNISVAELMAVNGLTASSVLKIGTILVIPETVRSSSGTSVSAGAATQTLPEKKYLEDPRTYTKKSVDKNLLWPVPILDISYLSGKLFGVVIDSQAGAPVRAIAAGRVLSKGPHRGYGQVVFVQTKNKQVYVYGGLAKITAQIGTQVVAGQELGTLAADSFTGKPRLYFMVYENNKPIDPAQAPRGN